MGNSQSSSSTSAASTSSRTRAGASASSHGGANSGSPSSSGGYPGHSSSLSSGGRRANNPVANFLSSSSSPSTAATSGSSSSSTRRHHHHSSSHGSHASTSSSSRRTSSRRVQHQHHPSPPPPQPPIDKSELVDAGHVAPCNDLYHATHHYDPYLVRDVIRARRLAPFYKGLEDIDEDQVRQVAQALDLRDEAEDNLPLLVTTSPGTDAKVPQNEDDRVKQWMAKVGGAVECPICFLYYPSNINKSTCCDQPICTECFVQIKRPDARNEAACPFCTRPAFSVVYSTPVTLACVSPTTATTTATPTLPTPPESSSQLIEPWPTTAAPTSKPMDIPESGSSSRRASESDAAATVATSPHAAVSPPSMASLTITATTHTRTVRSQSTSALATVPPVNADELASPGTSAPTASTMNQVDASSSSPAPAGTATESPAPATPKPVSSDELRPAYVRQLQQDHQLAILREHQDAAAARIRRMLHESTDPSAASSASSSSGSPGGARRGSRDGSAAAAAILASAMGLSRRQVERVYMRALGADLEELMVMEAMRASLAEEEERQRRAQEEEERTAAQVQQDQPAVVVAASTTSAAADDETPIGLLSEKHGPTTAQGIAGVPANVVVPVMEGGAGAASSSSAAAEAQASRS